MLSSTTRARISWWGACLLSIGPLACGGGDDQPCSGCHGLHAGEDATVPVYRPGRPAQPETWTPNNSLVYALKSDEGIVLEQSTTTDAVDLTSGELRITDASDAGTHLRALLTWPMWDARADVSLPLVLVLCPDDGASLSEIEPRTCSSGDVERLMMQGTFTRLLVKPDDTNHVTLSLDVEDPNLMLVASEGWSYRPAVAAVPDSYSCEYPDDGYGN